MLSSPSDPYASRVPPCPYEQFAEEFQTKYSYSFLLSLLRKSIDNSAISQFRVCDTDFEAIQFSLDGLYYWALHLTNVNRQYLIDGAVYAVSDHWLFYPGPIGCGAMHRPLASVQHQDLCLELPRQSLS